MNKKNWSMEMASIDGPDDLREATRGSDLEIVQLKPGRLQGCIEHYGIGNLGISMARFNSEIRARGALHQERVVLGIVLDCGDRVTLWWKDLRPGDVCVFPASEETDVIFGGSGAYLVVSFGLPELASMLGGEEHLADPAFWNTKRVYSINPTISSEMLQRLMGTISIIERRSAAPSDQAADFLRRSIIEPFAVSVGSSTPQANGRFYTGARLVSETEDYIDAAGGRPVHISELCSVLRVSRRSLHRAFADTLGIGPVAYLRRRRLSAIQSVLRRSDPATTSIGELAFEYGFSDSGRFASYYRAYFGETPSETIRSRSVGTRSVR